jgi:hypothetical protein
MPYSKAREEHRLKVFENNVLSRIFRPKRDVTFVNYTMTNL